MGQRVIIERHGEEGRNAGIAVGSVRLYPESCEIEIAGALRKIEPQAMRVMTLLARSVGSVVSHTSMHATCWEGRVVGEDAIHRIIGQLRRAIASAPDVRIETIPKIGYRLRVDLPPATTAGGWPSSPRIGPLPVGLHWTGRRRFALLAIAGLMVVVAAVGARMYVGRPGPHMPSTIVWTYNQGKAADAPNGLRVWRSGENGWEESFADGAVRDRLEVVSSYRHPLNRCHGQLLRRDRTLIAFVPDDECGDRRILAEDIRPSTGEVVRPWFTLGKIDDAEPKRR